MSQRKALFASIVFTLVLAFSAIGIRAAMLDSPDDSSNAKGALPLVVTGNEGVEDPEADDDRYEDEQDENEDEGGREYASSSATDDDDSAYGGEDEHEEDDDDD